MAAARDDHTVFTEEWNKMEGALNKMFDTLQGNTVITNHFLLETHQVFYNSIHRSFDLSDKLYCRLRLWLPTALDLRVTKPLLAEWERTSNVEGLFAGIMTSYRQFKKVTAFGKVAFLARRQKGKDSIEHAYLDAFHQAVYIPVKDVLQAAFIRHVNAFRDGHHSDMSGLKDVVSILIDTPKVFEEAMWQKIYDDFHEEYLRALRAYYKKRGAAELAKVRGHSDYLDLTESWLRIELSLATDVLRSSRSDDVRRAVELELEPYVRSVANQLKSDCMALMTDWNEDDLEAMYKAVNRPLCAGVLHDEMGKAMQQRIAEEGKRLLADFEAATSDDHCRLVTAVVELNKKYGRLIDDRFEKSAVFTKYRKLGFTEFLNATLKCKDPKPSGGDGPKRETSFSEVLATLLDALLKHGVDHNAELDRVDDLLTLVTYLTDKDVFEECHRAKLATRLLLNNFNRDLEKGVLEGLRREMGKGFTHRMESMLLDAEQPLRRTAQDGQGTRVEDLVTREAA